VRHRQRQCDAAFGRERQEAGDFACRAFGAQGECAHEAGGAQHQDMVDLVGAGEVQRTVKGDSLCRNSIDMGSRFKGSFSAELMRRAATGVPALARRPCRGAARWSAPDG
jgi:hypothetical protein